MCISDEYVYWQHQRPHHCFPLAVPVRVRCPTLPHSRRQECVTARAVLCSGRCHSSIHSAEMKHFLLRHIFFCMVDYSISSSFCLEQWCLYIYLYLSSLLWYLGGLNSIFGPYVKSFYCLVSDTCLIRALFAVHLNSASEGIGCLFCTKVDLEKPQKPHLSQASEVAVSLRVTARDPDLGPGWLGCHSRGDSLKEVPASFPRLVMIKKICGTSGVTTESSDMGEACMLALTL